MLSQNDVFKRNGSKLLDNIYSTGSINGFKTVVQRFHGKL